MRAFIASVLLTLICSGCGVLHPGIQGSGNLQSEFREVASFHEINLSGVGNANVIVGEQPSVQVTTDDNLLCEVETSVKNGVLKIRNRRSIRPKTGLNFVVTVPHLTATRVSGAGEMHISNLSGDAVEMTVTGAGTISADGHVQNLRTRISGAGDAHLRNLVTHSADVRISGAGDATVFAIESLNARVSGAGDVTCYGNPLQVNQHVSGAGDINIIPSSSPRLRISDRPSDEEEKLVSR